MHLNHGFDWEQINCMINVGVGIRRHPQTEVLAAMQLPPRRIARRETIDEPHLGNAQPAPVEQRRQTVHWANQNALENRPVSYFFSVFFLVKLVELNMFKNAVRFEQNEEPVELNDDDSDGRSTSEEPPAKRSCPTPPESSSQVRYPCFFYKFLLVKLVQFIDSN